MIANQKDRTGLLDASNPSGYHSLTMRRLVCVWGLLTVLLGGGCNTTESGKGAKVEVLSNDKFRELDCAVQAVAPEGMEGAASATNGVAAAEVPQSPLIGPGAQVTIYVAEDSSLNRQYIIPPGGVIDFPPLGRFTASGLTAEELGAKIKEGLERDYFRQATVEVTVERESRLAPGIIYVLGRVGRAGPIQLPADESFTLTKAILASGGGDVFANLSKVQIIRYCQDGRKYKTFVNVQRIMDKGEFENDVALRNGDWVIVPEKIVNLW